MMKTWYYIWITHEGIAIIDCLHRDIDTDETVKVETNIFGEMPVKQAEKVVTRLNELAAQNITELM